MEAGPNPVTEILHELVEALQATGGYLSALRRSVGAEGRHIPDTEVIERALSQWARAQHAVRELRAELNAPTARPRE